MVMLLGCYNHYRKKKEKVNRQYQIAAGKYRKGERQFGLVAYFIYEDIVLRDL
jgi:hypothetical protein